MAPDVEEVLRYQIPAFRPNCRPIHFAAFQDDGSFFAGSVRVQRGFLAEPHRFRSGTGTRHFTSGRPRPADLLTHIVRHAWPRTWPEGLGDSAVHARTDNAPARWFGPSRQKFDSLSEEIAISDKALYRVPFSPVPTGGRTPYRPMARRHKPRRGSLGFSPRKRSARALPRIRSWALAPTKAPAIEGFAGFKVGMTHAFLVDYRKRSTTAGQELSVPVTVVEVPPMRAVGARICPRRSGTHRP